MPVQKSKNLGISIKFLEVLEKIQGEYWKREKISFSVLSANFLAVVHFAKKVILYFYICLNGTSKESVLIFLDVCFSERILGTVKICMTFFK